MKLDDVRDLFAYLKTLPVVQGASKPHEVPFPFNIRRALGGWKILFLGKPFQPDPGKDAAWNRGAYLVNGPGHCAECHSPRNILGGIIASQRFAGGPKPGGNGSIPNITQQDLRDWSAKDIADMLETGMTPDDKVGGSMAEVVRHGAIERGGSRSDCRLHQIVAAGRGPEVAGEQVNLTKNFLLKALSALLSTFFSLRALSRRAVGAARPAGVLLPSCRCC